MLHAVRYTRYNCLQEQKVRALTTHISWLLSSSVTIRIHPEATGQNGWLEYLQPREGETDDENHFSRGGRERERWVLSSHLHKTVSCPSERAATQCLCYNIKATHLKSSKRKMMLFKRKNNLPNLAWLDLWPAGRHWCWDRSALCSSALFALCSALLLAKSIVAANLGPVHLSPFLGPLWHPLRISPITPYQFPKLSWHLYQKIVIIFITAF